VAKNAVTLEFSGTENLQQIFNKLPAQYAKKPVQAAFRKGAAPFIKSLKSTMPPALKKVSKAIGIKNGKGPYISAGIQAKKIGIKLNDGNTYDAYFPLYWSNYGTLTRRDTSHQFKNKIKASSSKRKGGIRPLLFVERSWEQTKQQAESIISKELVTQTEKFLQKYAI